MAASRPAVAELRAGADKQTATASFMIAGRGQASIYLTDIEGQRSKDVFTFPITPTADERPFIRIMEPKPESLATPDVEIPVVLAAEDDYGISRVLLFRSLNDSRPLALDVPVPTPPPARWSGNSSLPLGDCGVEPGDVIKLFARVEDNDPDGAKGSESPVVTIRIISQEDYERLLRTREGIEVMQAKYEQAQRHLEALLDEIQKLQKELEDQPPEAPLSKEQRKKMDALAKQFAQASKEIKKATKQKLPYDLDKKLSPALEKLAKQMEEAAQDADKLAKSKGMSGGKLSDELRKMTKKLGGQKKEFQEEATEPLEHLASIYPLMEDQALFTVIYQRQRDLAERLAALKGKDSGDDPQLKARMRDLELEQRQIREALDELLTSIEEHVSKLSEDEKLKVLRETASEFAKAVRESNALDAMTSAETGLAEFSGTRAHKQATEAADILESFLSKCKGMGDKAGNCLKFAPGLSGNMGNTIDQLLADAGLPNMGNNGPTGAGDGYSASRTSLQNVGLYGNLPRMEAPSSGSGGAHTPWAARGSRRTGQNEASAAEQDANAAGQAIGAPTVDVPVQYRHKVGSYFERIADEIGDEGSRKKGRGPRE